MLKTQLNRLLIAVVLFNLCAAIGCHRSYYRRQADADARRLIREKSVDPRWDSSSGTIDIDPQSRMFDPFSADHPPIPPDDPTSHQFMHRVDNREGYPHWHANGDTNHVENPDWRAYLPVNEKGQAVLTLERAYQLALLHSPDLQEQRETLYLSALDVSLDRFGFDTQLLTGFNSFLTADGRLAPGGSSTTLVAETGANGGGLNFTRLGITGAEFAVGLANSIMFNFAGTDTNSTSSLLNFSIIQPLLLNAGRDRILETLTQSERTLLANVRQMERFRRGFYLEIAIGRAPAATLNQTGNFLGIPSSASANAGGFFGLLEQQQQIRNQKLNVRQLESVLELFREFFLRERLDAVQLKLFETNVYGQQRTLLDLTTTYQTALDNFKLMLGLPPELEVVIDDSYLDRFELIGDQINERLISIGKLREETGAALNQIDELFDQLVSIDDIGTEKFEWPMELTKRVANLAPFIDEAQKALDDITEKDRRQLESDFEKLEQTRSDRLAYLEKLQATIESGGIESSVDPRLFKAESVQDASRLRKILDDPDAEESIVNRAAVVKMDLESLKSKISQFSKTENELSKKELYQYTLDEFQEKIPGVLSEMNNLVLEISLLQALARSNSIEIADVEIESEQAVEIARCMRRDWMNARASLVDNWRNIEFVADQLESSFDLELNGNVGNIGDNPFDIRLAAGQIQGGFRFDAPINRMSERNDYRQALIDYQQTRRQFYQFEDNVKQNLREILRNLNRNKVLFELDRRTVQVEIENVEINRFELEQPVGPDAGNSRLGATTAQNLANAIIGLNNAQNSFLGSWVEFEVLRRSLDFDLGTMQLDSAGQWIDPGSINASIGHRAASMMGIELDCQPCNGTALPFEATTNSGQASSQNESSSSATPKPQPQELPFESEVPATTPLEIDETTTPNAPILNGPEVGLNQQRSSSLFKAPGNDTLRPLPKRLRHQTAPTISSKTSVADQIKASFPDPATSHLSATNTPQHTPPTEPHAKPTHSARLTSSPASATKILDAAKKAIHHSPVATSPLPILPHDATQWQSQPSSLGGILDRFRTRK